jgi:hypothetical protein
MIAIFTSASFLVIARLVLSAGAVIAFFLVPRVYLKCRGERLVTCPETRKAAAVHVDSKRAALGEYLADDSTECPAPPLQRSAIYPRELV